MRKRMKQAFQMTAIAAALLSAHGTALAEGLEGSVSTGVGRWSNDRPQWGIYDGMRDKGNYLLLDGNVLRREDATGTWMGLRFRNLGLDNRELQAEWLRQGNIGGSVEYSRIPRDSQFTVNTGVQGIGTTRLIVPSPSITPGTGSNVELGTVRDRFGVKFFKNLGTSLKFNASFRNEEKDGTRLWGRGGAAEFAVEPISSTIRLLEATLTYSRDRLQLTGGYYGTSYENDNKLVVTSLSTLAAASFYNLSLPLDNKSHEVFLRGGFDFTPTTRGTFKASYSRATQDEALPTSTTPGLVWPAGQAPSALAPTNLDGRLDTTLLEAGLTSKPVQNLSVVANLRYRDFADKTPLRGIVFNASNVATVYNTPFSYTNKIGKLEATYRLPRSYSLLGGLEYNAQDRSVPGVGTLWVPFRAELNETTYRVQLRKSMSETVNGSLAYLQSKRDGGAYTVPGVAADPVQDLINPLNIADRKRNKWRGTLDWAATERLSLQFTVEDATDRYPGPNTYGLQEGKARLYTVDGSLRVTDAWSITGWVSRDDNKARETTQIDMTRTKFNNLRETGNAFGLGVRGAIARLKVGGALERFRTVNKYEQTLSSGTITAGLVPTPDINNRLLRLNLFAEYPIQKNSDLRFNVIYERWKTDDWTWMMFPATGPTPWAYGTATDGTTVTADPKQNSTFVGVRYIYKF